MDRIEAQLPKTLRQWVPYGLAIIILLLAFTVGVAAAQHWADDQFIASDQLKDSIEQLESYAAEAQFINQYTQKKSSPRAYTEAYSSALEEATQSVSEKLQEHPHDNSLDDKVSQTIDLANSLDDQLQQLATEPTQQLQVSSDFYQQLGNQLQQLEESL